MQKFTINISYQVMFAHSFLFFKATYYSSFLHATNYFLAPEMLCLMPVILVHLIWFSWCQTVTKHKNWSLLERWVFYLIFMVKDKTTVPSQSEKAIKREREKWYNWVQILLYLFFIIYRAIFAGYFISKLLHLWKIIAHKHKHTHKSILFCIQIFKWMSAR